MSTGTKLTGTVAEKYKALGAGNGFLFCRAKAPENEADKPTTIDTLEKCMAWYWLLEDFELTLEFKNTATYCVSFDSEGACLEFRHAYSSEYEFGLLDFINEGEDDEIYDRPPKDRANFDLQKRVKIAEGDYFNAEGPDEYRSPQATQCNRGINHGSDGLGNFITIMNITWYDDDTAAVTFIVTDGYHRFILTNLPTTADLFTETTPFSSEGYNSAAHFRYSSVAPVSLGTVDTGFGVLTGYDVSLDYDTVPAIPIDVERFTFNHKFFTFS